jgi:hypothetical protein
MVAFFSWVVRDAWLLDRRVGGVDSVNGSTGTSDVERVDAGVLANKKVQ